MLRTLLSAATLLSSATSLSAQTPSQLVDLSRHAAVSRNDPVTCVPLGRCAPVGFPDATSLPFGAGGIAWDPRTRGAWITNGAVLAKVADDCTYQCPPQPILLPVNAFVTGLEFVESLGELWAIDSTFTVRRYRATCPPTPIAACQLSLALVTPTQRCTGIAVDEGFGIVFLALTDVATTDNWLLVSRLGDPCTILQRIPVAGCPTPTAPSQLRALTGLAVDWCQRRVYGTDGHGTIAIGYQPTPGGIAVTGAHCCVGAVINLDPAIGLAVRPGRETTEGSACANGSCPSCPMRHRLGNDPNLGNGDFFFHTIGAPAQSLAWEIVTVGPCANPGMFWAGLCGPILASPIVFVFGPVLTNGTAGCDGAAEIGVPLPADGALCGMIASSQTMALCFDAVGALGTSLSNCITFELQGN